MSFQPQPTTRGTYRVKLYQTDSNSYWKYVPLGQPNPAWIQLGSVPESYPIVRTLEWVITPVSGQTDTFTIEPVYEDPNDSRTFGMTREEAFSNEGRSYNYRYQIVGRPGSSAHWKIVKDTSGAYSRIHIDNSSDVLGCPDHISGSKARFKSLVHFYEYQATAPDQRWVFELLNIDPPVVPPLPRRARSSFETLFFTLTPQKAAEKSYDIIVIGTGIGGGVIAGDLFESNSRLGKYAKSVLVIESGDLPFHSHCLNASRPSGFDEDRGQQNDTFFRLFREQYTFSPKTNVRDWDGGPMYNLGGRSAAWGLFSPRVHDEILADQFAPKTELHDELVRTWYRAAEDLMGLSLPTTTPAHQNLMERLNVKNNFRNNRNVQWQWGRIASEFREEKNFDFVLGAYSTIDKLLEIAMSKSRIDGVLKEHDNWSIILRSEVRSIIWDDKDFYQAAGVVVRDEYGVETRINLNTDKAVGKVLQTSNIILAAGSVQSPAILLRSGKKNFLESNGGLHITDHDIFAKGYSFHYLNPGDREKVGPMKIQTYVRVGDNVADGDIALANFSIDADSFLPKTFMPNQFYRNEAPPRFIAAFIRPAPLNTKNTIELDSNGNPIVTMNRDPPFKNTHKHVVELRNLTKEAMQVLQKELSIEIHDTDKDEDEKYFNPLGLGGVAHELGTIPIPGKPGVPYCLDADLKLRGHKGIYVCDLSVFPYSPEVNPSLALAALALRLSRTRILPRLPIVAKDDDTVYVMNQTGDKIQVSISNSALVNVEEWEKRPQTLVPGEYAARKRKYGILESVMVYKLDYNRNDVFLPEPRVYVARPGEVLTI